MAERKYYWLKFKEDFFTSVRIKKLRRLAGGDTLTIIYLKMQLKSIKTNGVLTYTGLERTFAEELALDLDESPEDVGLLLNYLLSVGLIETSDNINFLLPFVVENTGSETASAQRVRDFRERKALQSNAAVTEVKRIGNVEKDIDIDIDIRDKSNRGFQPPSLEEVQAYCKERNNHVDAERFIDFYESKGWMVGKNKMKNWKACVRTWEQRDKGSKTRLQDRHDYDYDEIEERLFGDD